MAQDLPALPFHDDDPLAIVQTSCSPSRIEGGGLVLREVMLLGRMNAALGQAAGCPLVWTEVEHPPLPQEKPMIPLHRDGLATLVLMQTVEDLSYNHRNGEMW